jgi:hypothetical protein
MQKLMRNVPFGMSVFQIEKFNRGMETPERLYRNCLLQLNQKMRALKECEFRRTRYEIDLEEIEAKLDKAEGFERRRLEVDREEKIFNLTEEIKLIEDCYIECRTYENILDGLPEFTREQFENAEGEYWEKKLLNDMRREALSDGRVEKGTMEALEKIGITVGRNEAGQIAYVKDAKSLARLLEI